MCANDQVICHEEYCPYARDYYAKLQSSGVVARLLDDHPTLEPDAVFAAAREAEVCPFEVSLELGGRVQVVVCDYNYAFDPYVALTEFAADNDLSDTILVIDEIHNLVGRGRDYYSPALSAAAARRAAEASARRRRPDPPADRHPLPAARRGGRRGGGRRPGAGAGDRRRGGGAGGGGPHPRGALLGAAARRSTRPSSTTSSTTARRGRSAPTTPSSTSTSASSASSTG